jgi:hypothetical protein
LKAYLQVVAAAKANAPSTAGSLAAKKNKAKATIVHRLLTTCTRTIPQPIQSILVPPMNPPCQPRSSAMGY